MQTKQFLYIANLLQFSHFLYKIFLSLFYYPETAATNKPPANISSKVFLLCPTFILQKVILITIYYLGKLQKKFFLEQMLDPLGPALSEGLSVCMSVTL